MAKENQKEISTEVTTSEFYVKLTIKGVEVMQDNIKTISIREWIFNIVPTIEIIFIDKGLFIDMWPLEDSDEIVLEISRNKNEEAQVNMTFLLQDFSFENVGGESGKAMGFKITGVMKTKKLLHPIYNRSFKNLPSTDAIKKIGEECGFEVDSKVTTSDIMTWLQINTNNYDMINHILDKSYKEKDDLIFTYTGRDGKLVITSLKTESKKDKDETKTIIYNTKKTVVDDNKENESSKDQEKEQSTIYCNQYRYSNISGTINKKYSYGMDFNFWSLNDNETVTINSDVHPLSDLSLKHKDFAGQIVKHKTYGIKFKKDNTHENYLVAMMQNEYIMNNFFSSIVVISIKATDDIKLFDKVQLIVPRMLPDENGNEEINEVFSGEYIIGGILHHTTGNGMYKMQLSCFRNGINKSMVMEENNEFTSTQEADEGEKIPKMPDLPDLPF